MTAQVLREVHILQTRNVSLQCMPFVLSNSKVWSLGIAEKVGDKIRVTNHFRTFIDWESIDVRMQVLHQCLRNVVEGKWIC